MEKSCPIIVTLSSASRFEYKFDANSYSWLPIFLYAETNFSLYEFPSPIEEIKSIAAETPLHAAWFNVPVSILYGAYCSWTTSLSGSKVSNRPGLEYKSPTWGP